MKKCLTSLLIALCMAVCFMPTVVFADGGDVEINETNFPDAAFRQFAAGFDANGDGMLSAAETANVTVIRCSDAVSGDARIVDLTGIEYFPALETLDCTANRLTALDVSKNTNLKTLYCGAAGLEELDVSSNTSLETLHCGSNQLKTLDISHNTALTTLDCSGNALTALDLSGNTALTTLDCSENKLSALDLSANKALAYLTCSNLPLTELDLSSNTALTTLTCQSTNLTGLDLSQNTALVGFECADNFYAIKLGADRTFDLSTLPGCFDAAKAGSWKGGTVDGATLTVRSDADAVFYTYDCGNGYSAVFALPIADAAPSDTNTNDTADTNHSGFPIWLMIVLILIVIPLVIAVVLVISKKNKSPKQ